MYNIKLSGLDTGRNYYVKVRAKVNGLQTSEWSIPFKFTAPRDIMPPGRVQNLSFLSEGDSFVAKWEAPTINEDGTPCADVSHYTLDFKDLDRNVTVTRKTSEVGLSIDFNQNKSMFGEPAGRIELSVRAVDLSGNIGKPVVAIAQNPPPSQVKDVRAVAGLEAIHLSWTPNTTDTDLKHYEIHVASTSGFTPSQSTLKATIAPETSSFLYDSTSLTVLFIKIIAVDKFNQKSIPSDVVSAQPRLTTDYDKEPPGAVTGFTVEQILSDNNTSAIAYISFNPVADVDLDKYEVQYRKTGNITVPWSFASIPSDQTSAEVGPLPLETDYDFRIRAVDYNSNKGVWTSTVKADGVKKDSLPPAPTNIVARGGMTNLMVTWTESIDPTMANWSGVYEVHTSKTPTFTNPIVVKTSSTLASLTNLESNTVYYVRIRSIDPFGNVGPWSNVESENTGEVEATGNKSTFASTDPTGTGHSDGDIWYRVDSEDNIIGMWEFFDNNWIRREVKNLADDSVTSGTIAADAVLAGHIKAGEIEGSHLKANTALINDLSIRSSLTIDSAGGHIKSSNYNANGTAGFYMDQQQLIINEGKIKAAAIELQDSQNLLPSVYAGLNHSPKVYEQVAQSEDGAVTYYWPNAGRAFNGALAHEGINTTVMLAPITTSHYLYLEGGQKYIVSGYLRMHPEGETGSADASLGIFYSSSTTEDSGIVWSQGATSTSKTQYVRVQFIFQPLTDAICAIMLKNNGPGTAVPVWSCFQIERVVAASEQASPWTPPGSTSIEGESIVTGSISSRDTVSTANGDIALWSIDTWGKARFADATIDGKLIVGGREGADNINTYIQSDSYVAGVDGWAIKGNGDVEFNNGTFRGVLSLEKAGSTDIDLKMTASVSPVKLYTDETTFQTIEAASIQGVTYAYNRAQTANDGPYYPSTPNKSKIGRYYIGPTTDRSVNIQVHEGEQGAVYLDEPPLDVALTSLYVGELTTPSEEPVERERQGFGFTAKRVEADPNTPTRRSSTGISQRSSVQLRSPFYPETGSGEEYPESVHLLETNVNFKAPLLKNLIYSSHALPDSTAAYSVMRMGRSAYNARAYELSNSVNASTYLQIPAKSGEVPVQGKRYIFSTYIDTVDATVDAAVYAFANGVAMQPLGENSLQSGQTEYQYSDPIPGTLNPEYRYVFDIANSSYPNSGSLDTRLTRTHGTSYIGEPTGMYNSGNSRYTAASTYNMSNGFTVSMWIKPTATSGTQVFFHRASDTTREVWIQYDAGAKTIGGGVVSNGTFTWAGLSNSVNAGEWCLVTVTYESISSGTKYIRLYLNGELNRSVSHTNWSNLFGSQPMYIYGNMQANSWFQGAISEPMVFHRTLTAQQVKMLYDRGTPIFRAGGHTALSQNGILVSPGTESNRISFEYTPSSSSAIDITLQVTGARGNKVFAYKLQFERTEYQDNVDLPLEIREKNLATAWTANGSVSSSTGALKLKSKPSSDVDTWLASSLGTYQKYSPPPEDSSRRESPAELELELGSSYVQPGLGTSSSASATYKWSTVGISYPGTKFPFMPTAASIVWDYSSLADSARPRIGGTGFYETTINATNASTGDINIGEGATVSDKFNAPDGTEVGYPWISVGNPRMRIYDSSTRWRIVSSQRGLTPDFVYHSSPLVQTDQELSAMIDRSRANLGVTYWAANVSVIINYDPVTESGIFARIVDREREWYLYVVSNGVITFQRSGTYSSITTSWKKVVLRRQGSRVTFKFGDWTFFDSTISNLPTGKHVGFDTHAGRLDDFSAKDIAQGSDAKGILSPQSINVNTGRGIEVRTNGAVEVLIPGYYMVTATIHGGFGAHIDRTYWMSILDYGVAGTGALNPLGGMQNRGVNQVPYVSGSAVMYLTGRIELRLHTDTTTVNRVSGAELHVVRMA